MAVGEPGTDRRCLAQPALRTLDVMMRSRRGRTRQSQPHRSRLRPEQCPGISWPSSWQGWSSPWYWQVGGHRFVNFDDNVYVSENPQVLRGLTPESVSWAFATAHGDNWYPLTWLSYMADIELFGLNAGWHHRVNMLLHLANTVLLFLVLWRMTGGMWQSGFVAALFGVHPLHVESVAWVSERKDVLSALFWMLTMGAYLRYARRPTVGRYLAVAVLLALGLMCKPMLVTLPCVLLLLDWWPLGRLAPAASQSARPVLGRFLRLVWEKVPLFGLSAASAAITYLAQAMGGSTSRIMDLTLGSRVSNVVVSYAVQLWRTVWPSSLGPFYPHPASIHADTPAWATIASVLLLSGLTVVALRQAGGRPFLAVGWFWFVGTMVPVIGLIQTGSHATADRFTHLPLVGVFIAIAWGIPAALPEWRFRRATLAVGGGAVVLALAGAAWTQVGFWRDSEVLWSRALAVTDRNWLALNNLGDVYYRLGRYQQALGYFQEAVHGSSRTMSTGFTTWVCPARHLVSTTGPSDTSRTRRDVSPDTGTSGVTSGIPTSRWAGTRRPSVATGRRCDSSQTMSRRGTGWAFRTA